MIRRIANDWWMVAALTLVLVMPLTVEAGKMVDLPDGSKLDTSAACPVCGMKVSSGTLGPAAVVFKDGKVVGMDGALDFFKYLLDSKKYGFDPSKIKAAYVTDYGTKKMVDAKKAFFVLGSDVKSEMGAEPIAFTDKAAAEKFMKEHKGKKVLAFADVTLKDVKSKKKMLKMKHKMGGSGSKSK